MRCLLEHGLDETLTQTGLESSGLTPAEVPLAQPDDSSPTIPSPRRFGDYELLEEIDRGGMGIIYRARQLSLGRIVAVKMILAGQLASRQIIARFRGEVTAAALLQHPNIVAIHDVGIHEDQHYFSMDYVEGQNLSQVVGTRPLSAARAARYVKLIAEGIHYAHQQGVLHRDLKPSNVLVDASDQPRITDFGLAKRLDGNSSMTVTGQMLGSPNFMPPEQASANRGKVGRPSDVYGLGAILYHLLTARPPFQAESFESVMIQVLNAEPVSPRLLNSSVPADLETICVKCLQKEPSRRYQSAQELADELDQYLRDQPIQARPITRVERTWRWCRRNPLVAGLAVALVLAIVIGFSGVTWQLRRLSREESMKRRNLYTAEMNLAHQAWEQGDLQHAQELLEAHQPQAGTEDLTGFEWRYLKNLCQDESSLTVSNVPYAGGHHGLALAEDGKRVLAASGNTLQWLDAQKLLARRGVQTMLVGPVPITGLSMAMDHPGLVAYRTDRVHALSPTGQPLLGGGLAPGLGGEPAENGWSDGAFVLSWDGTLLAASGTNHTVGIFNVKTGQQLGAWFRLGTNEYAAGLAFSPDAKYLACGTSETEIRILEMGSRKTVRQFKAHTAMVHSLAFDSAGEKLVSACPDSHIRVWSFPDCRLLADLPGPLGGVLDLAFSPDGRRLATVGEDYTVQLWDLANPGARATFLHGHRRGVKSVLFSRDGNQLYTASEDGIVKAWDLWPRESTNSLAVSDWSDGVAFSPDGKLVAIADWTGRNAVLYRLADHSKIGTMGKHLDACRRVRFSADGTLLATLDRNTLEIGGISTRKTLFSYALQDVNSSPAFHPSKPLMAVGCGAIRFWDLRTGLMTNLLPTAPINGVEIVTFSPKGDRVALGTEDGQVTIWDFAHPEPLYSFKEHTARISALCFSHDGKFLASGAFDMRSSDNRVVLYQLRSHRKAVTWRLEGHRNGLSELAFAPDDKTLVSASWDGTIRFWSMANHQVALTLTHDRGPANGVAFSPDGNLMATTGTGGKAILWPAAPRDETVPSLKAKTR